MSEEHLERLKLLLAQDHTLLGTSSSTEKKKEIRLKSLRSCQFVPNCLQIKATIEKKEIKNEWEKW